MSTNGKIHTNRSFVDQREAEANMQRAGVKAPRACNCPNPCYHTDYDGDTTCIYCGRAPRGRS